MQVVQPSIISSIRMAIFELNQVKKFVTSLNDLGSRIGEIKRDIKEKGIAN